MAGYNLLLIFFGTYVPLLLQMTTLIFGFIGKKKVKLFKNDRNSISKAVRDTESDDEYEDDMSSHTMSSNARTSHSGNSFFDPPIENYRFYA